MPLRFGPSHPGQSAAFRLAKGINTAKAISSAFIESPLRIAAVPWSPESGRPVPSRYGTSPIVDHLHYSTSTIKQELGRLLEKLGVSDRTRAATMAIELGIVELDE